MERFLPEGQYFEEKQVFTPEILLEAMETGRILAAIPHRCDTEHHLHFRLGGLHGVMPRDECAAGIREGRTKEIAILTRVGRPTCFVVEGLEGENGALRPRLSRRIPQERCLRWLNSLPLGTILPAVVTHLEPFGAFVDVGCGIPSLISLDRISFSRIPHPSSRFRVGDAIYVVLQERIPEQNRIIVSHKELMGTWEQNAVRFQSGEVVTGTVRGVMEYGLFVELTPNLPALAEPMEGIRCGDRVTVLIKSLLMEKEKIKLIVLGKAEEHPDILPPEYFQTEGVLQDWSYHRQG